MTKFFAYFIVEYITITRHSIAISNIYYLLSGTIQASSFPIHFMSIVSLYIAAYSECVRALALSPADEDVVLQHRSFVISSWMKQRYNSVDDSLCESDEIIILTFTRFVLDEVFGVIGLI